MARAACWFESAHVCTTHVLARHFLSGGIQHALTETITGTHMFITSGTSTVMIQHHLHHVDGSTTTAPHCL